MKFSLATFMSITAFFEKVGPILVAEVPKLIAAVTGAVESKASPASVSTVTSAVTSTAASLGLSSEDQANVQHVASAVASFTPVVQMLASAGLGASHVALISEAADVLTAAANGVLSAAAPAALPVALAPAV